MFILEVLGIFSLSMAMLAFIFFMAYASISILSLCIDVFLNVKKNIKNLKS